MLRLDRRGVHLRELSCGTHSRERRVVLGVVADGESMVDLVAETRGELAQVLADDEERRLNAHPHQDADDLLRVGARPVVEAQRNVALAGSAGSDERRVAEN